MTTNLSSLERFLGVFARMQTVIVNGTNMQVPSFVSESTILLLYSAKNKGSYSYSRIIELSPNNYEIETLSSYLKAENINIKQFENRVESVSVLFPRLTVLQIFLSYYDILPSAQQNTVSQAKFYKTIKTSNIQTNYKKWKDSLSLEKEATVAMGKKALEYYKEIEQYLPKTLPHFAAEEQSLRLGIPSIANMDIREVFHKIKITPQLPFVVLRYIGTITSHVHTGLVLDESWIDAVQEEEKDGITFYVCHEATPSSSLSFSKGFCDMNGNISVDVKITGGGGISNARKFLLFSLDAFSGSINQSGGGFIKGVFHTTSTEPYNRLIFCDMLDCDSYFKKFTFVSDYSHFDQKSPNALTSLTKERLMFYFGLFHNYNKKKCISAILTASNKVYKLRISKAKTLGDVREFMSVFSALIKIYEKNMSKIKTIYEKYYIPTKFIVNYQKEKEKVTKENQKTNAKLLALQEYDEIFRVNGTYAKMCQSNRQPYIVEPKNYEAKKKEINGLYSKNTDTSKFLVKYKLPNRGDEVWVGCAPNGKQNTPGFLDGTGAPCCFSDTKKKGNPKLSKSYIVNYSKLLGENQNGEIPFNFQPLIKKGEKFLRTGVPQEDSGLWCLEIARKGKKDLVSKKMIEKIKEELAEYNVDLEATQEGFSHKKWEDGIFDDIDVVKYRRVLESYFGVNIIILEVGLEDKYGQLVLENDYTYLPPSNFSFEDVVILSKLTKKKQEDVKIQYNLVKKEVKKEGDVFKFTKDEPFVKGLIKAYELTTQVLMVDVSGGV